MRPDLRAKNDWILKSYDDFKVAVINIAAPDLRYVSTLLAKPEFARRADAQPAIKRMISANTVSDAPGVVNPQPFLVREVPSRTAGARAVRIAFVGLTEPGAAPRGFKIGDPVEAARRAVPEARQQADVVIALGYLNPEQASRLAAQVAGIDAIIAANSQSEGAYFTPPLTVGQTLILFASYETRMLGELRAYREASGKYSLRTRFISLDETFPEDTAAAKLAAAANEAEEGTRNQSKKLLTDWLDDSRSVKPASGEAIAYASSKACAQCHQAQYIQWANSRHAHATDKLPPRWIEFEAGCLSCHATAQRVTGGKLELARLQSVQCEQCHGPGVEHIQKPGKGYGRVANVQAMCASCHTAEVSPNFDFQAAWAKIKH